MITKILFFKFICIYIICLSLLLKVLVEIASSGFKLKEIIIIMFIKIYLIIIINLRL